MTSLNNYLKKLLYQYDCVVVPELGAFLTHYQSASFTEATGQYLPPRKRVAFNEALRLDDGILINYIMLHESVSREVAQRQISQFVSDMSRQVDAQGRFDLDGIGAFSRNDEGRLQFEPSLRHNFFDEAYGMTAITATPLSRQLQTEPALDAVPVLALGPVLVRDEDTVFTPVRRQMPVWRVAAAVLLVGSLGLVSYFSVINPGQPLQSSVDPATLLRIPATWFARTSAPIAPIRKAAPVAVKPVATPAPVVVATPTAAAKAPMPEPVAVSVSKPAVADVAPVVLKKARVVVAKPKRSGPFFTVIAGSFAKKANAFKLRRQLHKAGYDDAYIIPPATKKQLFKVAASGFPSVDDATSSAATISSLVGTEAWIMRN